MNPFIILVPVALVGGWLLLRANAQASEKPPVQKKTLMYAPGILAQGKWNEPGVRFRYEDGGSDWHMVYDLFVPSPTGTNWTPGATAAYWIVDVPDPEVYNVIYPPAVSAPL